MSRGRANVWEIVWNNFVKSLKPRQRTGTYMGEDYFGNKYYEIPAQPQIGKRRPERWFVPTDNKHDNFDKELTAEWESWLRHRRVEAPTEAELKHNLAIMQMKKINAAEIDEKFAKDKGDKPLQIITGATDFPKYEEYESVVGKKPNKNDK